MSYWDQHQRERNAREQQLPSDLPPGAQVYYVPQPQAGIVPESEQDRRPVYGGTVPGGRKQSRRQRQRQSRHAENYGATPPPRPEDREGYAHREANGGRAPGSIEKEVCQYDDVVKPDPGRRWAGGPARDKFFAAFFVLHVIGMVVLAVLMVPKYNDAVADEPDRPLLELNGEFAAMAAIVLGIAATLSFLFLMLAQYSPRQLIYFSITIMLASFVALCVMSAMVGDWLGFVIWVLFTLLMFSWMRAVQNRITLSAKMLEIAASVNRSHRGALVISETVILFLCGWAALMLVSVTSVIHGLEDESESLRGFVFFLILWSFFWVSQLSKAVVHYTSAGLLASWYFYPVGQMPRNPSWSAFKRAVTLSLGSIAKGSLFTSFLSALSAMLYWGMTQDNSLLRACAFACLRWIEVIKKYINTYAYTYCAIYGLDFKEASRATYSLLGRAGLDAIINDTLVYTVVQQGAFLGGAFGSLTGGLMARRTFELNNTEVGYWALFGFCAGFFIVQAALEVVQSGVIGLFVCWAEEPEELRRTKPRAFRHLINAIREFYGDQTPEYVMAFVVPGDDGAAAGKADGHYKDDSAAGAADTAADAAEAGRPLQPAAAAAVAPPSKDGDTTREH